MEDKKQQERADYAVAHHAAIHAALQVSTVRDGDRIDPLTGEFIHGNGAITAYNDVNRISSNLFNKESHSDRLLDHFLGNKAYLDGKCTCPHYQSLLQIERVKGETGEYRSMRRRLIATA
jgi:hypothetical protein